MRSIISPKDCRGWRITSLRFGSPRSPAPILRAWRGSKAVRSPQIWKRSCASPRTRRQISAFRLTEVTRAYFARMAELESGALAADMKAILREPADAQAITRLSAIPRYNALLRTTCVATMMDAGHATNALPQRARATVNCRLLPGDSVDDLQATLTRIVADGQISIAADGAPVISPPAPLTDAIMRPILEVTAQMWP